MKNRNLQVAKDDGNDEFYTLAEDVTKELQYYQDQLVGKVIYCNCDNPKYSEFWKYFCDKFQELRLSQVISSCLQGSVVTRYDGHDYAYQHITNGSFDSPECVEILKDADIVITNPPFSKFRDYVGFLTQYSRDFLILGNQNAITYKEIYPLIQRQQVRLGVSNGTMSFLVPDSFERGNTFVQDGKKYAKFGNICWYTTLTHGFVKELDLTRHYSPSLYKKYDNYDAIDIPKIAEIPVDYYEPMGVPVTILHGFDYDKFELLGNLGSYGIDGFSLASAIYIDNKKVFKRILIRRKE